MHVPSSVLSLLFLLCYGRLLSCHCQELNQTKSNIESEAILDAVIVPFPVPIDHDQPQSIVNFTQFWHGRHPRRRGYVLTTDQAFSVNPVSSQLTKTSVQSRTNGCDIAAVNGGPFHVDGSSCGAVVVNGQLVQNVTSNFVGFGSTTNKEWILGRYQQLSTLEIDHFLTGFDWLIYQGKVVSNSSNNPSGVLRAARTAVGITSTSMLLLMVTDGCEKCLRNPGLTLDELASYMIEYGAEYAVNMDGGGSSTLVVNQTLTNRPTCVDVSIKCERRV
eukprot:Nitzschia sp. Nitz4//scaffold12_size214221//192697//193598//NITZ4_001535-RA/size214221-augustus-gene-0.38-mRNA-1//-1//CDS//3329535125//2921//frame0